MNLLIRLHTGISDQFPDSKQNTLLAPYRLYPGLQVTEIVEPYVVLIFSANIPCSISSSPQSEFQNTKLAKTIEKQKL